MKQFIVENLWMVEIFVIVSITLVVNFLVKIIYKKLHPKLEKTQKVWDDALTYAIYFPLRVLIWLIGITVALDISGTYAKDVVLFEMIPTVRAIGIVALFVWFLILFIKRFEINLLRPRPGKESIDRTTVNAIGQLLRIAIVISAGLILLQIFGVPISGVIAFGGVGGIAVGFAAKDLLSNFFGALMIFLDRPFSIGDWIRSPDRPIEGVVEHIGWRLTKLRTLDKRPLFIPNSIFSTIAVENPARMSNRRIYTKVSLRYCDATKIEAILAEVEKMLRSHEETDNTKPSLACLSDFAPSSLEFLVSTFTKTTDWQHFHRVQQDIFLKILAIIDKHGAECAFPTSTVHVPNEIKINK